MNLPKIGPKKAYKLVKTLKLKDENKAIQDLKKACLSGKVATIATFGKKSQEDILLWILKTQEKEFLQIK